PSRLLAPSSVCSRREKRVRSHSSRSSLYPRRSVVAASPQGNGPTGLSCVHGTERSDEQKDHGARGEERPGGKGLLPRGRAVTDQEQTRKHAGEERAEEQSGEDAIAQGHPDEARELHVAHS